jgi:hypothetical protein
MIQWAEHLCGGLMPSPWIGFAVLAAMVVLFVLEVFEQ